MLGVHKAQVRVAQQAHRQVQGRLHVAHVRHGHRQRPEGLRRSHGHHHQGEHDQMRFTVILYCPSGPVSRWPAPFPVGPRAVGTTGIRSPFGPAIGHPYYRSKPGLNEPTTKKARKHFATFLLARRSWHFSAFLALLRKVFLRKLEVLEMGGTRRWSEPKMALHSFQTSCAEPGAVNAKRNAQLAHLCTSSCHYR